MPHKHKSSKLAPTSSSYDLPPTRIAHALSTTKAPNAPKSHSQAYHEITKPFDDTPRAFSRLFAPHPPRSGLDDAVRSSKKRKKTSSTAITDSLQSVTPVLGSATTTDSSSNVIPRLQHNESLSAFSARVDAALPFNGIQKSASITARGSGLEKGRKTKTERKMQKMQKDWRDEDQRLRQKLEEEASSDEDDEESGHVGLGILGSRRAKRRAKDKVMGRTMKRDDDDPWANITAKRKAADESRGGGTGGLVGLHDVVQAPPRLKKMKPMKVGSGGLKRQVELSETRQSVIESYRQMMKDRGIQSVN